jgi:hypothetical protein
MSMPRSIVRSRFGGVRGKLTMATMAVCAILIGVLGYKELYPDLSAKRRAADANDADQAAYRPKITIHNGVRYLFAQNADEQFDATALRLTPQYLEFGRGREDTPALIEPKFEAADQADAWMLSRDKVLIVKIGDQVRVYTLDVVVSHEVVNDLIGDTAIVVVYDRSAALGAVYERSMDAHTYTFAASGYTYDPPSGPWDATPTIVLWDRDTESLWWPPLGKAVSGPAVDTPMKLLDESFWAQSTWGKVKKKYPHAKVLIRFQRQKIAKSWPRYELQTIGESKALPPDIKSLPPRWGDNADLPE